MIGEITPQHQERNIIFWPLSKNKLINAIQLEKQTRPVTDISRQLLIKLDQKH